MTLNPVQEEARVTSAPSASARAPADSTCPFKLIREWCASGQHRDLRAHAAEAHRDVASDAAGSASYQDGSIAKIAGASIFDQSIAQP
jgi:hypothetical protein